MRRLLTFLPLLATGFATAQTLRTEGVGGTPRFAYDASRPGVVALGLVVASARLLELRDRQRASGRLEAAVDGGKELGDGRVDG